MKIIVFGTPAPQGSKSYKGMFTGRDGRQHAKLVESSKKVRPWRQDVVAAAIDARAGAATLDGPLVCSMVFTLPKPNSAPKSKRSWACKKPDLSKLVRSTEDALVTAGVIADDARIVEFSRIAKVYPGDGRDALGSPGCVIEIFTLTEKEDL